jgi:GNAT superfamily N-acetyltransferase
VEQVDLVLRDVRYDDDVAQELVEEVQQEYVVRYGGRDGTPVDPDEFAPPGGLFLVAYVGAEPVGCVGLRRHDDEVVEMKRLFVRTGHRRRGLARAILRALEDRARSLGYRRLILETGLAQPEAIALYESSGYERIPPFGHYAWSPDNRCFGKDLG